MDPHLSRSNRNGSVGRRDAAAIIWSGSRMMENRWQMAMSYQEIRVRPWLRGWRSQQLRTPVGRCRSSFSFPFPPLILGGLLWAKLAIGPLQIRPNKIGGLRAEVAGRSPLTTKSNRSAFKILKWHLEK